VQCGGDVGGAVKVVVGVDGVGGVCVGAGRESRFAGGGAIDY